MTTSRRKLGDKGEAIAAKFLIGKGFELVDHNVHAPGGELDLIMKQDDEWVFVEVKTRRSHKYGTAIESVGTQKIKRMLAAIEHYFLVRNELADIPIFRIDIVAVEVKNERFFCEHFSHIEGPEEYS
jgi:putative endonuclease